MDAGALDFVASSENFGSGGVNMAEKDSDIKARALIKAAFDATKGCPLVGCSECLMHARDGGCGAYQFREAVERIHFRRD